MKKKIDFNSVDNQGIKSDFVNKHVLTCFSYEMEAVLRAEQYGDNKTEYPLPAYEDIENFYQYVCPNCGSGYQSIGDFGQETKNKNEFHCPSCDGHFAEEPENEPQEILEWWIVDEWLYSKLKEHGEAVLEWGNNHYWGRTTSGQAIMLDGVISAICEEQEILQGQKYDWSKNK